MYFVANAMLVESSGTFTIFYRFLANADKLVKELIFCFLFLCKARVNIIFPGFFVFVLATGSS